MGTIIEIGINKEVRVLVLDDNGDPATGETVEVLVRRISDDNYWNGSIWAVPVAWLSMVDEGVGQYSYTLPGTQITVEDTFVFQYRCTAIEGANGIEEFMAKDIFTESGISYTKLPDNNIMGSSVKTDKDDEIDAIKNAIIVGSGIVASGGTDTVFPTDLSGYGNDYWNNVQIMITSGNSAGQVRRISDFAAINGIITVSEPFDVTIISGVTFLLIGRYTGAGSTITDSSVALAVWDEFLSGHITAGTAGKIMQDIKTVIDSIQLDTNDIQTRLPASLIGGLIRAHIQAKDTLLPLSTQEKADVRTEVDAGLVAYDGATQSDLNTAEINIISEIDGNEAKIDLLQVDLTLLLNRLGIPPTTIYDALKSEIDTNEGLILTLTGNLATHDSAIKGLIGTPSVDLITDLNARFDIVDADNLKNYNAIIQIQNNVSSVLIVPERLVRPDAGSKTYKIVLLNYDSVGNMEDFDADPSIKGDYISGGVLFASTIMTHVSTGYYSYELAIAFDETLGTVMIEADAVEGGNPRKIVTTSEVSDYDDELVEIYNLAHANYIKLDAATPSPTIPAQLTAIESNLLTNINENQTLIETVRDDVDVEITYPNPAYIKTGYSVIDSEVDILTGATTIPIIPGTDETFNADGGLILVDKGEVDEEYLSYTGIVNDEIILVSPTTKNHTPGATVFEITKMSFHATLRKKDGLENIEADILPLFSINKDDIGVDESGSMTWENIEARYYGYVLYDGESIPGKRTGYISLVVGGSTRDYTFDFEVVFRPSSERQINEAIGTAIPPNTFVFDHVGWMDESGIKHEWDDMMAGAIKDDAGQPLVCLIKAYLYDPIDVNVPILGPNPPYDHYSNPFGHYVGGLPAGKYLFTFIVNGKKWKQVDRYINYP